ncbi:MAG: hypothetical protein IKN57_12180, partial [Parasporobacterium sp.]|nr:hypothetical protein [Parasporobacterium sp.]
AIETITSGEADASELEGGDDLDGELLRAGITAVYLKTAVINRMGDNAFKRVSILGGKAGLTVLQSKFPDEDGAIDFVMTYEARMPFLPGRAGVVICSQRTHCYAWKGTKRWAGSEQPAEENDDPVVYVTEHGTVYHTDLNCTYLNRTVESAFLKQIQYMRNDSGGKYTLCERCGKYNVIGPVYYTKYGDRYHTILSCPALERNIRQIRLSEAGGKPLCSKCAKSGRKE